MTQVNIHDAKTNLSRLVAAIKDGSESEVVIAQNGVPAAKLVPIEQPRQKMRFGLAKGKFSVPDNIDRDNEYIAALFEGRVD
jgi:prevent-host-death family protein